MADQDSQREELDGTSLGQDFFDSIDVCDIMGRLSVDGRITSARRPSVVHAEIQLFVSVVVSYLLS